MSLGTIWPCKQCKEHFPLPPAKIRIMLEVPTGGEAMNFGDAFELLGQFCLGACFLYFGALVYFFIIDGAWRGGF